MDYSEYDNPENSENLDTDSENPDLTENNSENTIVRTKFILPDPGKGKCRKILCDAWFCYDVCTNFIEIF